MRDFLLRTVRLVLGLFLFALGSYLTLQANVGLAPWEALSVGVMHATGISYGNVVILTGVVILIADVLFKEKIGFGTILNTILLGKFVDWLMWLDVVPVMQNYFGGIGVLLLGQLVVCIGSYFYIGAALGCGPRDSLMVALGKRFTVVPIGAIRALIEGSALGLGWLLGAKIGVGTVISVFGLGMLLQGTFYVLKFDVKGVRHQDLAETFPMFALGRKMKGLS